MSSSASFLMALPFLLLTINDSFLRVDALQVPLPWTRGTRGTRPSQQLCMSILDDIKAQMDNNDELQEKKFNPFDYSATRSISSTNYSGTMISLRKTTMTELLNELLNMDSVEGMQPILENYKDFLLEPLEDMDAVLDPDSIYSSTMNREARYQAYQRSMEERISQAQYHKVMTVLTAMKDYVLSFQ
jgi:hypothetical protein